MNASVMLASEAARRSRLTACSLLPPSSSPYSSLISLINSKRVVQNVPTFDFCADIVAGVPDPISDETGADGEPKKKRAPRKKKEAAPKEEEDEDTKPEKDEDDDDYEE
jgi:hypothetical protein